MISALRSPAARLALVRYGGAVALAVLGLLLKLLLAPLIGFQESPFLAFFAAVTLSALLWGFWPGIITLALAGSFAAGIFMPLIVPAVGDRLPDSLQLAMFLLEGLAVVALCARLRTTRGLLRTAQLAAPDSQRAEAARLAAEGRFRAIWEAAVDAMALSDAEGTVIAANPAYFRLYGYERDQVVGQSFAIIFPPELRAGAQAQYREIFQSRAILPTYESTIQHADGTERIVESHADFVTMHDGQVALLSIIRDITDRKRAEQQRDRLLISEQAAHRTATAALEARDQFLGVAAHELKNPLAAVSGYAQTLLRWSAREPTFPERERRALQVIYDQSDRLNGLIDSLLDISRLHTGSFSIERRPLDLVPLLRQIVDAQAPALELHRLTLDCQADTLLIEGDRMRLEQVFVNLIQNAVKYSPNGGEVTVELARRGDSAAITVTDQGIGIPLAAHEQIFQKFYRVPLAIGRIPGMGVGLYVVKEIIDQHCGVVTVQSEEGQGSSFCCTLPLASLAGAEPS